jgi:hypothetical protein
MSVNTIIPFDVVQACALAEQPPENSWLIETLWGAQAVGILGGQPKSCKTWMALEMAVSVASGTECLGSFAVPKAGPVLVFCAEDSLAVIRQRLYWLAQAHGVDFDTLAVHLITSPLLRLDLAADKQRLQKTIELHRPRFLILDPFIRIHKIDENSASEVSDLLGYLRGLQRRFELAITIVHHCRKNGSGSLQAGQGLRGSGDFHAWGDSNIYLHQQRGELRMIVEHRAAKSQQPRPLQLVVQDGPPHLELRSTPSSAEPPELEEQILNLLSISKRPLTQEQIRCAVKARNARVVASLRALSERHLAFHSKHGWNTVSPMGNDDPNS